MLAVGIGQSEVALLLRVRAKVVELVGLGRRGWVGDELQVSPYDAALVKATLGSIEQVAQGPQLLLDLRVRGDGGSRFARVGTSGLSDGREALHFPAHGCR